MKKTANRPIWYFYFSKKQKAARLRDGDTLITKFKDNEFTEVGGPDYKPTNYSDFKLVGKGTWDNVKYINAVKLSSARQVSKKPRRDLKKKRLDRRKVTG